MRPWLRCCCCCGGSPACTPWTEFWASVEEVEADWTVFDPVSVAGGELTGGVVARPLDGVYSITTTIGVSAAPGEASFSVENPGDEALRVTVSWIGAEPVWSFTIGDAGDIFTPDNPTEPQTIEVAWDYLGNFFLAVGDEVLQTGFSLEFATLNHVQAGASGAGTVGAVTTGCTPFDPEDVDQWQTEDGQPWLTEVDSEEWEMEYA